MIIGSKFSKKNQHYLKVICRLSEGDTEYQIPVQEINNSLQLDRTQLKNILEYLQELGYIEIVTIGGPLLYGHVTATKEGLNKCNEMDT